MDFFFVLVTDNKLKESISMKNLKYSLSGSTHQPDEPYLNAAPVSCNVTSLYAPGMN